ncbi:M3 family metallopeptidase [Odoribacter lunatus]|uniref:M3 family metallopeptidase n=1 Tax=Odoribacter lunatus TaxID=2941335 RepID=UPI0020421938|nr:M3 family metallopeptidase [Odoribacter lunatus]
MKKITYLICLASLMIQACQSVTNQTNPFLKEFDTPHGVPPFHLIQNSHYLPAFKEGIRQQQQEIKAITDNTEAPTFANTVEALEKSGQLLNKVAAVFFNLQAAHTNDSMQAIAEEVAPLLSEHTDGINLNEKLFERIKTVYENKDKENLSTEQLLVLEKYYKDFVRGGANLSEKEKERLKQINGELSILALKFGNNLLKETNNYQLVIENEQDLSGLPEGVISTAAETAKEAGMEGKWVFTLHNPSIMPFLQYADNRALREEIYKAYTTRGNHNNEYDNKVIISQLVALRLEKAQLLGFPDYASYVLEQNMAKNPANVYELCNKIWEAALPVAKKEAQKLQSMITRTGGKFKLQPWDWRYYAEKVKQAEYGLDENELRQYFPLDKVREGAFYTANKLYGITFSQRTDLPLPHPDAIAYEVKGADGKHIGIFYADYFPRPSKGQGAWMDAFRSESGLLGMTPVITNVCNFTKPTGETPSLLTFEEAQTLFHEFGHALHGLLSQVDYPSVAGTNVVHDFVELPSQIMENWAADPEVLKVYARHYKTGEPIPQHLIDKLQKSSHFNQGFATTEFMAAALLDMAYHTVSTTDPIDVEKFEKQTLDKLGLIPEITVRYRSTYFSHIFDGGYSAGYYAYTWAEVLDADAFEAFKETGDVFNPEKAEGFHRILAKGGSEEAMKLYTAFRGKEPSIEPLLKRRGLK